MADPDDVDRRFAELIASEFGQPAPPLEPLDDEGRRSDGNPPPPLAPPPKADWYHPGQARLFGASSDDDVDDIAGWNEDYAERELPGPRSWSPWAMAGGVCFALGVLIGFGQLFGAQFAPMVLTIGGVTAIAGLAMLVLAALRRRGPDDDGPGAVI